MEVSPTPQLPTSSFLPSLPNVLLSTCCTFLDHTSVTRCRTTCRSMYRATPYLDTDSVALDCDTASSTSKEAVDIRQSLSRVSSLTIKEKANVIHKTEVKMCLLYFTRLRRLYLRVPISPLRYDSGIAAYEGLTVLHVTTINLLDMVALPLTLTDLSIQHCGGAITLPDADITEEKGWKRLLKLPLTHFECRTWASRFVWDHEVEFFERFSPVLVHLGWHTYAFANALSQAQMYRCHWPRLESLTVVGLHSSNEIFRVYNFDACPRLTTFNCVRSPYVEGGRGRERFLHPPLSPHTNLLPSTLTHLSCIGEYILDDDGWKYLLSPKSQLSLQHLHLDRCLWQTLSPLLSCRPPLLSLCIVHHDNPMSDGGCNLSLELLPRTLVELRLTLPSETLQRTPEWFSSFLVHCPSGLRSLKLGGALDFTIEHLLELGVRCSLRELELARSCRLDTTRLPETTVALNTRWPDLVRFRIHCCSCCKGSERITDFQSTARRLVGESTDTRIQFTSSFASGCLSCRSN